MSPLPVIDLRKILAGIRSWDELNWDGHQLAAVREHQLVDRAVHRALLRALGGIGPVIAVRESYRKVIVIPCTRAQALQAILLTYPRVATVAVDNLIAHQPRQVLEAVMETASTPRDMAQRINRILIQREQILDDVDEAYTAPEDRD